MLNTPEDASSSGSETSGFNPFMTRSSPEDLEDCYYDSGRGSLRYRLRYLYGEETFKKTQLLGQLRDKMMRHIASMTFLKRCRDHDVIPECCIVRHHSESRHSKKILKSSSNKVLKSEIRYHRRNLSSLNSEVYDLHFELISLLSPEDWESVDRVSSISADYTLEKTTRKQQKKFDKIFKVQQREKLDNKRVVVNLTRKVLDVHTEKALSKGFNFCIAPKKIPAEKIICGIESAITGLPLDMAEEIRQDASVIIRRAKPPQNNISKAEILALNELKKDSEIVVLPADKGNATILMYHDDYKSKMNELLSDDTYIKSKNPTQKIKSQVNKLIKDSSIEEKDKKKLLCRDPRPPLLYGLPKIHKQGIPMRPIVSAIGSPTHEIARYLAEILQPFTGKTVSYIKNSSHFVEKLKAIKIEPSDILVSFDIVSLFTNVPLEDTISLIRNKIPEDLAKIVECCLESTYFLFDGDYYTQRDGAPMGSPLSPVAANIFMEDFEERALSTALLRPEYWWRYVDDTFLIWKHGRETLNRFLDHMNSVHPKIKFTMEVEDGGCLPFLDVLVTKKNDGTLAHKVYRKPTHTDRYLNAESHHHPSQKNSVINSLVSRGHRICDESSWDEEKQYLRSALSKNGFKIFDINRAIRREENRQEIESNKEPAQEFERKAFLPYVKGTTCKLSKLLRRHGISTTFTSGVKMKSHYRPVKDPLPLKTSGVYKIPCDCGKSYIGQTGRLISTRLKEHIRATKNNDVKSAVAEHSEKTGHLIKFEDTKVIAAVPRYHDRLVREAVEIAKNPDNFNREDGFTLSNTWKPVIRNIRQTIGSRCSNNQGSDHQSISQVFTNNQGSDPIGQGMRQVYTNNQTQGIDQVHINNDISNINDRYNLRPRNKIYK